MDDTSSATAVDRLLGLMAALRTPGSGCPWDLQQTFASVAPYTIEEAYDVADAIARDDLVDLKDELGDLLLQVVFHARMAEERGWFDFAAVASDIDAKLRRRHPHLFAGATLAPEELVRVWEQQKAQERASHGADASVLGGVPLALPALTRAAKLGRRAGRVGFDWQDAAQVRAKVLEELGEVDRALCAAEGDAAGTALTEELGDLLFSVANWCRHLEVNPEDALRRANAKFERRFRRMEELARSRSLSLEALSAPAWDALWEEAKLNGA